MDEYSRVVSGVMIVKQPFFFEKGNGLLTKEYLAGVVGSTSDGVICYGNSEGLTYFRPSQGKGL